MISLRMVSKTIVKWTVTPPQKACMLDLVSYKCNYCCSSSLSIRHPSANLFLHVVFVVVVVVEVMIVSVIIIIACIVYPGGAAGQCASRVQRQPPQDQTVLDSEVALWPVTGRLAVG